MASNCQVPTPHKYVQDMLSYVDYTENLYGKKILENSCGDGNILIEIVERYIKDSILRKYSVDEIKKVYTVMLLHMKLMKNVLSIVKID